MGPSPVSWQDIDAFARRSGVRFSPWEIEIIEKLDDIFLSPSAKPPAPEGQAVKTAASADDPDGVRSVLGAVGVRKIVKRGKATHGR